ncbi:lytic murein transglycosylase [Hydrogenophilus thermoluteolus]|nr:lytic murein transglycosylase [Hydrogenophilus thermoluteolus]MBW7657349.1 lytic murein transglycosylase [Hydrogenophilus thermoluteolus]
MIPFHPWNTTRPRRHHMRLAALAYIAALVATPGAAAQGAPDAPSQSAFQQCLADLKPTAAARGVPAALFDRLTARLEPDPRVLALLDRQPEFVTPIWQYLANLVDRRRIGEAQEALAANGPLLRQIERRFGVEAELIVAFWAVESNFGRNLGRYDLIQSLATLACFGRRQAYFRGEFVTLTEIIARGDITSLPPRGSWAGAFGHTQFMPSTFAVYAVDGDGDGIRDLYGSLADVFASTANFLKRSGWRYGEPWGIEVRLPPHWQSTATGRLVKRTTREWLELGLTRADGKPWDPTTLPERAALLLPAGSNGPAILVFPNYDVLYRYNAAESYTLAVGLLFDALRDPERAAHFDPKQPFRTPWPTDEPPLTRSETETIQSRLTALGYDPGPVDGVMGATTREALRRFQLECLGDPAASGWPDARTRAALTNENVVCPSAPHRQTQR